MTADTTRARLEETIVVDADVHVHEMPVELAPYCDMPWRKALENLANVRENYLDIPGFSGATGTLMPGFPGGGGRIEKVNTAAQMREELDALGIDIAVLFPDHLLKLAAIPSVDYASCVARAYNRYLIDQWTTRQPGLVGALVAAPQDPQDAAREIERFGKEETIVAVYLPTSCVNPLWGDRRYDPIFAAAEQAGLPVLLHSVTAVHPVFPFQLEQFDTEMARHALAHPFSLIANLVSMICSGVPVRFPQLKIGFTEGGVSWVPFVMMRLDKEYIERRREVPFLTDRPSTYIKKMYFATQPVEEPENPADLVTLIRLFNGEETTIFASDWPHHDFDHPRKIFTLPMPADLKRNILGLNALKLFGLPTPVKKRPGMGELVGVGAAGASIPTTVYQTEER